MCVVLFSSLIEMKWCLMLLLAVLCTTAKTKNSKNVLDSAMRVNINRHSNVFNFKPWKYAKKWLSYSISQKYKKNHEKRIINSRTNYASSNAENDRAVNDMGANRKRPTIAHFSHSYHKKVVRVLMEENLMTNSKFDQGWIHQIKNLQNSILPLNLIMNRGMKRNMMEHLHKTAMEAHNPPFKQKMCQSATLLERYVCTLLSPDIIITLDMDLATVEATYATMQKYHHCNELFNKDNSPWMRSLSLLGCLQMQDQTLWRLLSKWLQVNSEIMKAFSTQ